MKENHYQPIVNPRPGDLAIYHDDTGDILHSGIVRGMIDKNVMIESKWGPMGVYLHFAQECFYGSSVTYYRSDRQGHILQGLNEPAKPMNSTFIKHEQQ